MKKIVYLIIILIGVSMHAQAQGAGRGQERVRPDQQRLNQQNRKPRAFKASEVAGLFFYDIDKVLKKLNLKNDKSKPLVVSLLKKYNTQIKEIEFSNADTFTNLNKIVNAEMKSIRAQGNNRVNNQRGLTREKAQEIIRPIRQKVRKNEKNLNNGLKDILTEKELKKWVKYQKAKKDKLKPKRPQRNNNQGQGQRGNRQRGGF
ncbi:hypothetical protein DUT90_04795 [Polaribacter sp. WD7]|uniref:hypothetical protein n=1 Tax=Polaribacter sp. WD7 TaxID=2269061 RepID=UPI000DF23F2C|nr:hypothetical protein [Polaribacter sp. WD7]RCS27435.1 hypothetical protein DUT90_04795 [Polaribacter sp. WD7]